MMAGDCCPLGQLYFYNSRGSGTQITDDFRGNSIDSLRFSPSDSLHQTLSDSLHQIHLCSCFPRDIFVFQETHLLFCDCFHQVILRLFLFYAVHLRYLRYIIIIIIIIAIIIIIITIIFYCPQNEKYNGNIYIKMLSATCVVVHEIIWIMTDNQLPNAAAQAIVRHAQYVSP